MCPEELETSLVRLGQHWPASSVADAVIAQLNALEPRSPQTLQPTRWAARRWGALFGVPAAVLALSLIAWTVLITRPSNLFAQVEEALRKAKTVHIQITTKDGRGQAVSADLWYARNVGLRAESPDQIVVDDGRQQWSWNPQAPEADRTIMRRASRKAVEFLASSLQLGNMPNDWKQSRSPDLDRMIGGTRCAAQLIEPPASVSSIAFGDTLPSRLRFVAWQDEQSRVVRVDEQRFTDGTWQVRREIQLEYDVEMSVDRFTTRIPETAQVVDFDRRWESRYPLEKAFATKHVGGLLFAVHELIPCEDEMYFVVSSVRGTPEHLQQFPPQRRFLNLQTTIVDVAEQHAGAFVFSECHRVTLTSDEVDGVHYLWWIAAPRRYFDMKDGKAVPRPEVGVRLDSIPGHVRIPLYANYRDSRLRGKQESTQVEVALPEGVASKPLSVIADKARRDALLVDEGLRLYGGITNDTVRILKPTDVTAESYALEIKSQLEWLRQSDRLTGEVLSGEGMPPR